MNYKKITKEFEKNIHSDLKDKIFLHFYIENNEITDIVFTYGYQIIEIFDASFYQTLKWYYDDPEANYLKILNSNNIDDLILAIIDKQTGNQTLNNFDKHLPNYSINKFLKLRR